MVVYLDFNVLLSEETGRLLPEAADLISLLKQKGSDVYVMGEIEECENFFSKYHDLPISGYTQKVDFIGWMNNYDPFPDVIIGVDPPPRVKHFTGPAEFTYLIITHKDGYKEAVDKIFELK